MNKLIMMFAIGFGLGRSKVMPGTIGCLIGLPIGWLVMQIDALIIQIIINLFLVFLALFICERAEKLIGGKDPQCIVADEYLTLSIVVIGLNSPLFLITGFIFHRVFDIVKPFPINKLQDLSGGLGVVADDLVASIFAWICNLILFFIFSSFGA